MPSQSEADAWRRRGLLIEAPVQHPWSHTHAALPAVEEGEEGDLHIYYSPRDERGRAHIARARLEVGDGGESGGRGGALRVSEHEPKPVLSPGPLGAFDDAGVTVSCVVAADEGTLLYYTGWALGVSVPFYFYAGLAIRPHGEQEFRRVSPAPILERDAVDPYLTASPWVLREGERWRMWYVGCARWELEGDPAGAVRHYYHVRYAESDDGVHWRRQGRVALDFKDAAEYAMGRPCVVRDADRYRMWLCARGDTYRLAYAESPDGVAWERADAHTVLAGPSEEWDSEMQAYPAVFDWAGERYLLYNGNGYGRSGVGYAVRGREE